MPKKSRYPDRPNLIESNPDNLTLGDSKIEDSAVAAPNAPPPPSRLAAPPAIPKPMFQPIQPRPFNNRGDTNFSSQSALPKPGEMVWPCSWPWMRRAVRCRPVESWNTDDRAEGASCAPRNMVIL